MRVRGALGAVLVGILALAGWAAAPSASSAPSKEQAAALAKLRATPGLFISPCGQPFRSAPGEPYPVALWFAQVDKNGDGKIDRAEFRADAEAFFKVLDRNHDGVIDGFELSYYEHNMAPEILGAYRGGASLAPLPDAHDDDHHEHGRHGAGDRAPDIFGMQGAVAYELFSKPEPVAAADLNVDGHITLPEFLRVADQDFNTLDKTGRGYLTLADLPKTPLQAALEGPVKHKR